MGDTVTGNLMAELFDSGHIIDLILGLVAIEVIALALWRRWYGTGPSLCGLAATLTSGGFLLLAVRAALVDASWQWIALACSALCWRTWWIYTAAAMGDAGRHSPKEEMR
jgi:hypothetical protein